MLYAEKKKSRLQGNLNTLTITEEPAFPCLQAPSCSSYYNSISAFLTVNLFMQWQVDQSVNRKLPPLPLPSSCMAAALIGNNGICSRLPTATLAREKGAAPLPRREAAVAAPLGFSLHCKRVDEKEVRRESSVPGGSKKSSRLTVGYLFNDNNNRKDKWEIILLCLDSELALRSFAMRTCHWDFMKGHI